MASDAETLSAQQAADLLGIRIESLYAYVSRGLIRSEPAAGSGGREKVYLKEDLEWLLSRKAIRKNPDTVTSSVLRWGEPSLDSKLTLISDNRYYYRGEEVTRIAKERSFEEIASFVWSGEWGRSIPSYSKSDAKILDSISSLVPAGKGYDWLRLCQLALILHEERSGFAAKSSESAWAILYLFVSMAVFPEKLERTSSVCDALANLWNVYPDDAHIVDEALSLCLDHELNISSFTARCAASSGASLHASVVAALSAFRGPKHGANILRVQAFLTEIQQEGSVVKAAIQRQRRGESIPGFGHPLYSEEDPRAKRIYHLLDASLGESEAVSLFRELRNFGREQLNQMPNIDMALGIVGVALSLPHDASLQIATIGRSAGWIGHAFEQRASDQLIRPRARYTGKPPRRRFG